MTVLADDLQNSGTEQAAPRRRKRANDRIDDLCRVADAMVCRTRSAEISLQDIADELRISRALVYAYFPDRFRLLDAVLERHLGLLEAAGLSDAAKSGPLVERLVKCARILLDHSVIHGQTVELVLREADVARQLDGSVQRYLRSVLRALARQASIELRMNANEALALIELLSAVPLDVARRVETDGVSMTTAHSITERLVRSMFQAQVPTGRL